MKLLFFILLTGYAVRSDENNYYVIEIQDNPPNDSVLQDSSIKPFKVYWNVPTMQCASKKVYFENLYEDYGIIQNNKDQFKGENITILYDPGLFPALFKNESNGKYKFRNGGVPQEGDLNKHLEEFKKELDRSIPSKNFSGVAIIDFESWRPIFRQNFDSLEPYKTFSVDIERSRHWWWKKQWLEEEAKRRFEDAARAFMKSTLIVAKELRPLARWGFYAFPYCFNMASKNMVESCARQVPQENDEISWLWSESTALYPSVYSSSSLTTSQLEALIRGRLREAARCSRKSGPAGQEILPYFWYRYRDAGFMSKTDLSAALSTFYSSRANGIIIWGSSNDVNTLDKCTSLLNYVKNTLGPAISKYTKPTMRDDVINKTNDTSTTDTETETSSSIMSSSENPILNSELDLTPTENYTQVFINEVKEEINQKFGQNETDSTVVQNNNVLIDLILNAVLNNLDHASTTSTESPKSKYDNITESSAFITSTTEFDGIKNTDTSQVMNNVVTRNPLFNQTKLETQNNQLNTENQTLDTTTEITVLKSETITETKYPATENTLITTTAIDDAANIDYDVTIEDIEYEYDMNAVTENNQDHTIDNISTDFTKEEKKDQINTEDILRSLEIETFTEQLTDKTTYKNKLLQTSKLSNDVFAESNATFSTDSEVSTGLNSVDSSTIKSSTDSKVSTGLNSVDSSTIKSITGNEEGIIISDLLALTKTKVSNESFEASTPIDESKSISTELETGISNIASIFDSSTTNLPYEIINSETITDNIDISEATESTETEKTALSIELLTNQVSGSSSQVKRPYIFCFVFYILLYFL